MSTHNAVRKSKELFFVSDITTSDGPCTDAEALHPVINKTRTSNLHWPTQASHGIKAWKEWRTFISKHLCHNNLCLRTPLGHWLPANIRTQQWFSQFDPTTDKHHWCDSEQTWVICTQSNHSHHHITLSGDTTTSLPPSLIPITIQNTGEILTIKKFCNVLPSHLTLSPPMTSSLSPDVSEPYLHQKNGC